MTYIIPFNAGGESDVSARYQQSEWEAVTGQQVVIQYQPGAGGAQAWSQLNSLPGDGYTVMGINMPHTVLQPLAGSVGYKTEDKLGVFGARNLGQHPVRLGQGVEGKELWQRL
ncbi:MAG: tripartite tricarboxylate transporter substrate-binding protein, partial [Pseudomonadota bacterium]|nr:tripartite tricarboxylate transporter substrate-binding protein [Pseudomonadota bacterium]